MWFGVFTGVSMSVMLCRSFHVCSVKKYLSKCWMYILSLACYQHWFIYFSVSMPLPNGSEHDFD